jgi:Cytochrome P460
MVFNIAIKESNLEEENSMKRLLFHSLVLMILILTACNSNDTNEVSQQEPSDESSEQASSGTGTSLVKFPENYDKGVLYTTVTRGNTYEELYTSREAIEAVQNGEPIPSGTVITLEIYEDEELDRIFVMEKRNGWADQNSSEMSNGDWQYQEFTEDGSVNEEADIGRCFSCHANQERDDYVNTLVEMKDFDLDNITGFNEGNTESKIAGIPIDEWEVKEVGNNLNAQKDEYELIADMSKEEMIQKALFMIHFNKENS